MIDTASFRFYHGLDNLLAPALRGKAVIKSFRGSPSIKHMVESMQIPHTEVGRVEINGQRASLATLLHGGETVDIYPADPGQVNFDDTAPQIWPPAFLLDTHLGKLATYLRILGVDARYSNDARDEELADIVSRERLVLLTRDRHLLMRKIVRVGYLVRSLQPVQQLEEVIERFALRGHIEPFQRCLCCNVRLQTVERDQVLARLEPLTRLYYNEFRICPLCERVYWKGSHYEHMQELIKLSRGEHIDEQSVLHP